MIKTGFVESSLECVWFYNNIVPLFHFTTIVLYCSMQNRTSCECNYKAIFSSYAWKFDC
jgi:hypothetical protein